ncbi:glycine zipper 2TM domain-containing protein [Yersinia pestis]|uniref:glycine zipper 2TM domain-containing protein n=1 Tax=Yersinia pseudotuberculosis complex TaxID=1649845 RepID=UPI0005E6CEC1|nr:glycine zipper 2TM domain-containing protein [Yersinia pseudotuberculosis]CND37576.1 outer membrane lipoprotein [Yersinia pseudotuberculosis]
MNKLAIAVALAATVLSGCANNTASGDTFTASQARQVQTVTYGSIVSARPVTIQGGNNNVAGAIGGAVVGGFLGNTIGGGRGNSLATAGGAVAGGVAGQGIQSAMNRSEGVQLEIRRDDGSNIVVVQAQGPTRFSAGQRVIIASDRSGTVTVSPR